MNNVTAPPSRIDPHKLYEAMARFAGRVAQTDDPKQHQHAGKMLKVDVEKAKVRP